MRDAEEVHHRRAALFGNVLAAEHTNQGEVHATAHLKDHEGREDDVSILTNT